MNAIACTTLLVGFVFGELLVLVSPQRVPVSENGSSRLVHTEAVA
jgi:hypothetical protein